MKELAVANFTLEFKQYIILFQGVMFFSFLIFWISSFWGDFVQKLQSSKTERLWFLSCLGFGFFLSAVFGYDWGTKYTLLALSIGLSLGLALSHPGIAACLLAAFLFLRPWELIQNNDYFMMLPKLTFSICVAHVLLLMAARKKISLNWNVTSTLLLFFAIWAYITTFKAADVFESQNRYSEVFFKSLFLYFVVMNVLSSRSELRTLIGSIILTFLGVGLISVTQTLQLAAASHSTEMRLLGIGAFSNSNDTAALMVLVFPFCFFAMMRSSETFLMRVISGIVLVIATYSIYLSQSRGAMLSLLIAIGLYAVLKIKNTRLTFAFIGLALLAIPALITLTSSGRGSEDLSESSSSRLTYVKTGFMMALKNPVFGVGYEAYEENFERYATEILFEWGNRTAHNSWILALAELGLIGFFLYMGIFITSMKYAIEIFDRSPEYLIALTGYGAAMTFLSHTYLLYPYLLFGLIGAARRYNTA